MKPLSMSRFLPFALALPLLWAPGRLAAQQASKTFGGKVLEANGAGGWFIMQGGASKRYARVKILLDKRTKWTGVPRKEKTVRPGDNVRVVATSTPEGAFRATSLDLQDPQARPAAAAAGRVR